MDKETTNLNTTEAVKFAKEKTIELANESRITVNSMPTFEEAKKQLIKVKEIKKVIKSRKEGITKPLNEALKNTRALFKPVEERVGVIEEHLNGEVLKYNSKLLKEQEEREAESKRKIEEEIKKRKEAEDEVERLKKLADEKELTDEDKKNLEEAEEKADVVIDIEKIDKKANNTADKISQIKTRKITKLRITEKSLIPLKYLEVNEVELKRALATGEKIIGAELYTENISVNSY